MKEPSYTVLGFKASSIAAGLKKAGGPDMALIFSETEAAAAGVFTKNKVQAAPVSLSKEHLKDAKARAIIANAGNANACTGAQGSEDAERSAGIIARGLGIRPSEVLVASTGIIGQPMDMGLFEKGADGLIAGLSPYGIQEAAQAILTTDSFPKISMYKGEADGQPYSITGIGKGAGMIMPDMATMLCFILTDIRIDGKGLKEALAAACERSFNRITVDGDTSTNDTVFALANGAAANTRLSRDELLSFEKGLQGVTEDIARMMVKDGEGATKVVSIEVAGAVSRSQALTAARTVANSTLVKTCLYGEDPNWGRIMAALGRSGVDMKESEVDIWIGKTHLVSSGLGKGAEAERKAKQTMKKSELSLVIDLHQGPYREKILTCDLTHEYVSINAEYRT